MRHRDRCTGLPVTGLTCAVSHRGSLVLIPCLGGAISQTSAEVKVAAKASVVELFQIAQRECDRVREVRRPQSESICAGKPRRAIVVTAQRFADVSVEGQWATLTVEVRNTGTGTANDVAVTISHPAGTMVGGGENPSPPGWNCTFGESDWTCASGSLAPGTVAAPLTLNIYIPAGTTAETVIVGAVATVTVHLPVPAGMRGVSTGGVYGWDCSLGTDTTTSTQSYDCTQWAGGLASGATSEPLTITMQVAQLAPGDTPVATVTTETRPGIEENTANNTASATVSVVEPGFLSGVVWSDYDRDGIRDAGEPGENWPVQWVTVFPQNSASGDPVDYPVSVNADGTWRLLVKPGRYVVQAGVDPYYSRSFSPPNVGDDATDSDVVPVDDPGNYYRYAESAVIDVTAGGENVIDIGIIDS